MKYLLKLLLLIPFALFTNLAEAQVSSNYSLTTGTNESFDNMTGSTTMIGPNQTSDTYTPVYFDFELDFLFMGEFWNQMQVSPNGIIWFGNATDFFTPFANNVGDIPNSRRISAFALAENTVGGVVGVGMRTTPTGRVHYKEFGTAPNRHVTVEYFRMGANNTSTQHDVSYQVKFYETNSRIEFVYGRVQVRNEPVPEATAGFQITNINDQRFTINVNDDSFSTSGGIGYNMGSRGVVTNLNSNTNLFRKYYYLESIAPNGDPSDLTASCLGSGSLRLDWTDNSTNELGFVVYGSSDGGASFSRLATSPTNNVSITGLTPATTYLFRVFAYTEGQVSSYSGSDLAVTTSATGSYQSIQSGDWSDVNTWDSGIIPTNADDVIIGCLTDHIVAVDVNASTNNLTVKSGSTLSIEDNQRLSVTRNAINNGTIELISNSPEIQFRRNFTNTGTFDFSGNDVDVQLRRNLTTTGTWIHGSSSTFSITNGASVNISSTSDYTLQEIISYNSVTNAAIPDNGRNSGAFAVNAINVPLNLTLKSIFVDITHPYNGDVEIFMLPPNDGFQVVARDKGLFGDNYDNVTFRDDSPNILPTTASNFSGDYRPEELLSTYAGSSIGNWTIVVADDAAGDVGTLNSWGLEFENTIIKPNVLGFHNLVINNSSAAGITVEDTDIQVDGTLTLTDGIIYLENVGSHALIMNEGSVSDLPSDASHIDGPVVKIGNSDFTFPVGDDDFSAAIRIEFNGGGNADDEFRSRYFHQKADMANPLDGNAPYDASLIDAPIEEVNDCEYWLLDQQVNTGTPLVVHLSYDAVRSCFVPIPLTNMVVAHWTDNGSTANRWKDEGHGGVSSTGVFSSAVINDFSPFTLGYLVDNPLPVQWINFELNHTKTGVELIWSAIENPQTLEYMIQKSTDAVEFQDLEKIIAEKEIFEINSYQSFDNEVNSNIIYYRIKQIDLDGTISYSSTEAIRIEQARDEITIFPNPTQGDIVLNFYGEENGIADLEVLSIEGKNLMSLQDDYSVGENSLKLELSFLPTGTYIVNLITENTSYSTKIHKH